MRLSCLIALGLMLCSCVPQKNGQAGLFADQQPVVMSREAAVTVSLGPEQVGDYEELCRDLNAMAWDEGVEQLLHMYVNQAPLLRPVRKAGTTKNYRHDQSFQCDPWQDQVTGMISQNVRYAAFLTPQYHFGGTIDSLQDNQTMGGMLSRGYVTLWGPALGPEPIPILIVQQSSGLEQGVVQVVGSGMITQVTDTVSQMRILESTREIFPGDMFFQLQILGEVQPMIGDFLPLGPGDGEDVSGMQPLIREVPSGEPKEAEALSEVQPATVDVPPLVPEEFRDK